MPAALLRALEALERRDIPDTPAAPELRRRLASRVPALIDKIERRLELARDDSQGPDPEAALENLRAAARTLASFLLITTRIAPLLALAAAVT